jgi:TolB-like protein
MEQVESATPRGRGLVVLGIAVAIGVAIALAWRARTPRPPSALSIAVLPLENRSASLADAYLAAGIQDELTNLLARAGPLRVTSRNSTERYATARPDAARIGRELGVDYLLSGGVERAGEALRVDVRLLDGETGASIWGSRFERRASDVFPVESEVAQAVAEALQGRRLTAAERSAVLRPPTTNAAAYHAYLRARSFSERTVRNEADILAMIAAYEEAVRLDPGFESAWAQLSRRQSSFFSLGFDRTDARREAARLALEHAEYLAPNAVDAQAARAYYLFVVQEDLEGAERAVLALEARYPDSPDIATGLSQITRELGDLGRSAEYARRAVQLDPLNPFRQAQLCQDYLTSRETVLALHTCDRARELLPGDAAVFALSAAVRQTRGDLPTARALLRHVTAEPGDWRTLRVVTRQFLLDRHPRDAVALLESSLATPGVFGTRLGVVRRWLADAQRQAGDAGAHASYAAARGELEAELARQPENPLLLGELAIVRARLGDRDAAVALAGRCTELARASRRTGYIGDCGLARIQVALATNAADELPGLIEEALEQRGSLPPLTVALLRRDPDYDAHRALVRRLTPD